MMFFKKYVIAIWRKYLFKVNNKGTRAGSIDFAFNVSTVTMNRYLSIGYNIWLKMKRKLFYKLHSIFTNTIQNSFSLTKLPKSNE